MSASTSARYYYNNVKYLLPDNLTLSEYFFKVVTQLRFDQVNYLLRNGVNANIRDLQTGKTALIFTLSVEDDEKRSYLFRLLLKYGANHLLKDHIHARDTFKWAILQSRIHEVKKLVEMRPDALALSGTDANGQTALHIAAQVGNEELVHLVLDLLEKYAITDEHDDRFGFRPFLHATRLGHHKVAAILVARGHGSTRQFDSHYHLSTDAWRCIGELELQTLSEYERLNKAMWSNRGPSYEMAKKRERVIDVGCAVCHDLYGTSIKNKFFRVPKRLCVDCLWPIVKKYRSQVERKSSRIDVSREDTMTTTGSSQTSRTQLDCSLKPLIDVWTIQLAMSFRPSTSKSAMIKSDFTPEPVAKTSRTARFQKRSVVQRQRRVSEVEK